MLTNGPYSPLLAPRDPSVETRSRLDTLGAELASGRRADAGRALESDFSAVSRVTHALRTHETRNAALSSAATWLDQAQGALGRITAAADTLTSQLSGALTPGGLDRIDVLADRARGAVTDMVAALSVTVAGRSVFGNGDPSGTPPVNLERLLADTQALAATATSSDDLMEKFDRYFGPGDGYEAAALGPFPPDARTFPLGGGESLAIPVNAGDDGIRQALKQATMLAALPTVGFALDGSTRADLAIKVPVRASQASSGLVKTASGLGGVEERVSRLKEQLGTERTNLEARKSEALAADPFETATRLQNEMTRLESIYAVTARRSRLRLTDYLR